MPMDVSTRQLRAFLALADSRSFTRAAAQSHLSQPAFSALIRALEEQLGLRLFDRTTRSVELTVEGRLFEESARRVLHEAQQALADLRAHAARQRGRVSLALLPSLAAGWLPPLLASFHERHPDIVLDVADVLSEDCVERVRSGRADFALASTRADTPELRTELFCSDRFHLVCRRDHPLAKLRAPRMADVAAHPIVQLSRSSSVRHHVEAAVHPRQLLTVLELDQLSTVAGMLRAGLGVSLVPELTLFHFRHPELLTRPVEGLKLKRQIFVVRRRDRSLSIAAQALYEELMANPPKMRRR
jgi:LysR family transcriptional regulator, carnitine catabolism transcriptional activator